MARRLSDIDLEEVSLVDTPAVKRKFLIVKKRDKMEIAIQSDGTIKGTKIIVNGQELKDIADFNFSFYTPREMGEPDKGVSCSYSKITESEDGFQHSDTFYLIKSGKEVKMEEEMTLEDVEEKEAEVEKKLSDKAVNAIKGALKMLGPYKDELTGKVKDAVGVLAEAAGYGYPEGYEYGYAKPKKEEKVEKTEELTKSGRKISKETKKVLESIVKQILSLIEEEVEEATEIKKTETLDLDEITKYIKKAVREALKS